MKITVFGATGQLGRECAVQCLDAGHEVVAFMRSPEKLPEELRGRVTVVQGDGLVEGDVARALDGGVEAVLFAIGIDKHSPEDLCTDVTRHILAAMPAAGVHRFVWCGGGSTLVPQDRVGLGAKFVEWFASTFMSLRHRDKEHQLELLNQNLDRVWLGIRPLQMRKGPKKGDYRVGFDSFSGLSVIHFADCADAMIKMLNDDSWIHKAPIVQY
ncbi:MAG: NAD(P)H-binding protein [Deltaproteobacteria bacterium]|nr:NAD(P)H-binding protein [Deltaproteobacteria bacterium]MBW2291107.1 NAD(P)H-binding protein [Deltaproteobacteria bacterium]MBW2723907.1 NAD(P)H-binding protein [Deltaproteobacteria bacterium]